MYLIIRLLIILAVIFFGVQAIIAIHRTIFRNTKASREIKASDFRLTQEIPSLVLGLCSLFVILILVARANLFVAIAFILISTIIFVWISQSQHVGGSVKVTDQQFPDIFKLAEIAAKRLCMKRPELFISQSPTLNAYAIGFLGKKSVVLHSALVEAMSSNELLHIIGHEFSHIKCGHTNIIVLTNSKQGIYIPVISELLSFIFLFHSRLAESTCDRGGLIASRNITDAVASMAKLAVGSKLFEKLDIGQLMEQKKDLDQNDIARLSEGLSTHPYVIKRIHAMVRYFHSNAYKRLIGNHS